MNDANHENPLISFKDSCKNFLHESLNDSLSLARFCSRSDANYHTTIRGHLFITIGVTLEGLVTAFDKEQRNTFNPTPSVYRVLGNTAMLFASPWHSGTGDWDLAAWL